MAQSSFRSCAPLPRSYFVIDPSARVIRRYKTRVNMNDPKAKAIALADVARVTENVPQPDPDEADSSAVVFAGSSFVTRFDLHMKDSTTRSFICFTPEDSRYGVLHATFSPLDVSSLLLVQRSVLSRATLAICSAYLVCTCFSVLLQAIARYCWPLASPPPFCRDSVLRLFTVAVNIPRRFFLHDLSSTFTSLAVFYADCAAVVLLWSVSSIIESHSCVVCLCLDCDVMPSYCFVYPSLLPAS